MRLHNIICHQGQEIVNNVYQSAVCEASRVVFRKEKRLSFRKLTNVYPSKPLLWEHEASQGYQVYSLVNKAMGMSRDMPRGNRGDVSRGRKIPRILTCYTSR